MSDTMKNSLEQQARDILERAGDEHVQQRTAGDGVEIANLLAEIKRSAVVANQQLMAEIERLREALLSVAEQCKCSCSGDWLVKAHTHHPDCRWYVAEEAREAAEAAGGDS